MLMVVSIVYMGNKRVELCDIFVNNTMMRHCVFSSCMLTKNAFILRVQSFFV